MSTAIADPPPEISDYEKERGKPMPSVNHSVIEPRLAFQFYRHEKYEPYIELTLDLTGQRPFYTPDLSVYPKSKIDFLNDKVRATDPPLTTVEILSPTQPFMDLVEHANFYFEHGVKSCWIVTPAIKNITILLPGDSQVARSEGVITDPATGLTANLDEVFA